MLTVATWNVLHRIHAENWGADVPGHWPDGPDRIAAVTARLAGCAEQVLALQESVATNWLRCVVLCPSSGPDEEVAALLSLVCP